MDSARVDGIEEWVKKFINLPKNKIQKIVKKLKELELIEIICLPNDKQLYYFHDRRKVNPDMLDDDLRFKRDFGSDSPLLNFSDKIDKKVKHE